MAQAITFTEKDGGWEYTFTSSGRVVVQLNPVSAGRVQVYATWSGMRRSVVADFRNPYDSCVFGIDMPAGMDVTIHSEAEITLAKIDDAVD